MDPRQKNRLKNLVGLLLAPVVVVVLLRWFEHRQTYHPTSRFDATGDELGFPREDVWLETSDGVRLHAWSFQPEHTNAHTVLLSHGNGGNISHRLELYDVLLRAGFAVLAYDYRGYGQSEGSPSEAGTYLDAEAALSWLEARGTPAERVIAYGESLGGAVATELACRHALAGLILQSAFTSVPDLGAELFPWLPVRTIGKIQYDNHAKLPDVTEPVLILHSRTDTLIPFHHAERNFEAATAPKRLVEVFGDHNDTLTADSAVLSDAIRSFFRDFIARPKGAAGE